MVAKAKAERRQSSDDLNGILFCIERSYFIPNHCAEGIIAVGMINTQTHA